MQRIRNFYQAPMFQLNFTIPATPIVNPLCFPPLAENICLMFANAVFTLHNRAPVKSYNMMKNSTSQSAKFTSVSVTFKSK